MLFVWIYVLFELSVQIKERGLSFQTFPHFQLSKKKLAVTKVFASVELQGSTFLTGMGLKIRYYAALAASGVWLPLSISFSISFISVYWMFGLRFFRMLTSVSAHSAFASFPTYEYPLHNTIIDGVLHRYTQTNELGLGQSFQS